RLETILRERSGRADLVLANYFDLIGGTSTGAIIAAALAIGMSAKEVEDIYLEFGGEAFSDRGGPIGVRRLGLFRGGATAPNPCGPNSSNISETGRLVMSQYARFCA